MSRRGLRIRILATLLATAVVGSPLFAWPSVARAATANLDNWSVRLCHDISGSSGSVRRGISV